MTRAFGELTTDLLLAAPGCPGILAERLVRMAADEFCRTALVWKTRQPLLDMRIGRYEYTAAPPENARVAMILSVSCEKSRLAPALAENLAVENPNWRRYYSETPTRYVMERFDTVRLIPIPNRDADGVVELETALAPAEDAEGLEDFLWERHGADISLGARAMLLDMESRPWSDRESAMLLGRRFRAAMSRARANSIREEGCASMGVRPRSFV